MAGGQQPDDGPDRHPQAADAGSSAHDVRILSDSLQLDHGFNEYTSPPKRDEPEYAVDVPSLPYRKPTSDPSETIRRVISTTQTADSSVPGASMSSMR